MTLAALAAAPSLPACRTLGAPSEAVGPPLDQEGRGPSELQGDDMFGIIGQMLTTEKDRDRLIEILLRGTHDMPGCRVYAISKDTDDASAIWITEIWDSEQAHRASLELPAVQAAIQAGRPLIQGFGARHTVQPVGGIGVSQPSGEVD